MKTKEITIYVSDSGLEELGRVTDTVSQNLEFSNIKAYRFKHELKLNVPDNRKVEISETEFDEILKQARSEFRDTSDCIDSLKQRLFSK